MAFRLPTKTANIAGDPEALFRDLRSRKVEGLLAQQADTLRSYMGQPEAPDIALELPTGSGKTLVGLLIAEWRRRRFQQRCVFLCPTVQLVHQVVEQSLERYGITTLDFSGKKIHYSPESRTAFENCEAIGIATYSALFNTNTFFHDVGTVIFDDAHAAENYVSSCWSLEVNRRSNTRECFIALTHLFQQFMPEHERSLLEADSDDPLDTQKVNKIPLASLLSVRDDLISLLDTHCQEGDLFYRWSMLREHVHACNLFYTSQAFLLRPILPPTESFVPFTRPTQRVYMSATLGEGGDLERVFGRARIQRIPAPKGWDKQGIGRRFFVFPMRTWTADEAELQALAWIARVPRSLILTTRDSEVTKLVDRAHAIHGVRNYTFVGKDEMEASKKAFTNHSSAFAVLANRYDGIDLNGDECRYLIVHGLPEATNLQERFLMTRMAASILFEVRLRTRVTQALGRCTRSATDWSLVVILGDKLNSYFARPENRKALHPELQAEVEFGFEQSKVEKADELVENIDVFFQQGSQWKTVDDYILEKREGMVQTKGVWLAALQGTVTSEIGYLNALWNGQYDRAVQCARQALELLAGEQLRGYRAWWYYLAGNAAHLADKAGHVGMATIAVQFFRVASTAATTIPWLNQLAKYSPLPANAQTEDPDLSMMVEGMELELEKLGKSNSKKIEALSAKIRSGLNTVDSDKFESSQVDLGRLMGFGSKNSSAQGGPDPWWILGRNCGIVFEDYTETGANPVIAKFKVQQAKGHPEWLKMDYPEVHFKVVFCSSTESLDGAAEPFVKDLSFIGIVEFKDFAEECLTTVRELWNCFPGTADLAWRANAMTLLAARGLSPGGILKRLTARSMSELVKR